MSFIALLISGNFVAGFGVIDIYLSSVLSVAEIAVVELETKIDVINHYDGGFFYRFWGITD